MSKLWLLSLVGVLGTQVSPPFEG
ncbi:MAG: hypothetical protein H6Q23_727, partial [Bacteroidetes bacterium]|nr:hypothetical protein [Bacteroidota bacterium]